MTLADLRSAASFFCGIVVGAASVILFLTLMFSKTAAGASAAGIVVATLLALVLGLSAFLLCTQSQG